MNWYDIPGKNFKTYGFDYGNGGISARIPECVTKSFCKALSDSALFSAGGRIRFCTNFKNIGIRVHYGFGVDGGVAGTAQLCRGFELYKDEGGTDTPVHIFALRQMTRAMIIVQTP